MLRFCPRFRLAKILHFCPHFLLEKIQHSRGPANRAGRPVAGENVRFSPGENEGENVGFSWGGNEGGNVTFSPRRRENVIILHSHAHFRAENRKHLRPAKTLQLRSRIFARRKHNTFARAKCRRKCNILTKISAERKCKIFVGRVVNIFAAAGM